MQFQHADFIELPFEDGFFDGVWAYASLVHLETIAEVEKALQEFYRVLKTEGILHILVKQQMDEKKTSVITDALSHHDRFFRWFTKDEVQELVEKNGFVPLSLVDNYPDGAGRQEVKWIYTFAKKE
jgi:ubiquinone/menaquinone biosynthesis C-methylase UbiE